MAPNPATGPLKIVEIWQESCILMPNLPEIEMPFSVTAYIDDRAVSATTETARLRCQKQPLITVVARW